MVVAFKLLKPLLGAPSKSYDSATNTSGFSALPQFAQDAFKQTVSTGTDLAANPSMFAPAGLTPEQLASLSTLTQGLSPTSSSQFQTGLSTFGDPFEEQVIQNAIRDINTAGEGSLSDARSMASAAGGFGGTRQALLEAEIMKNTQRNIGDISSQMRSQGFQSAADRTLSDLARTQDVAGNLFGLGEVGRGIQTATQQAPITANSYLADLAQGFPASSIGGSSGVSTGEKKSMLDSLVKLAGGAAAASSDIRLKENIKQIGKEGEFNIYEFNYKNDPDKKYSGVMAQEVLKINPDAVALVNDFYVVDYNKIGVQMKRIA